MPSFLTANYGEAARKLSNAQTQAQWLGPDLSQYGGNYSGLVQPTYTLTTTGGTGAVSYMANSVINTSQ